MATRALSQLDQAIIHWDNQYPLDRWWRLKYKVPFGSAQHKEASHFNMFLEFREEELVREHRERAENADLKDTMNLLGQTTSESKEVVKMSQKEIDREFADLDITQFGPKPAKKEAGDTNILK